MNNTLKAIVICASLGLSTVTVPALAQGVPTVDTQNITQQIRQLSQMLKDFGIQNDQLDALLQQITLLEQKLAMLEQMHAALTGETDIKKLLMGGKLDGILTPEIKSVLKTLEGVKAGDWSVLEGEKAPEIRSKIEKVLADAGFDEDALRKIAEGGDAGAGHVADRAVGGAVLSVAAEVAHEEAAIAMERVDALVELIPEMETVKAAVDHNTRVTAELAIALTKMWELEAIQTINVGQEGVTDAATIALEQKFMDFTLPDLK